MVRTIFTTATMAALAVVSSVLVTGCEASRFRQANENPLLGSWTLNSGPTGCSQRLVFTETQERAWISGTRRDMDVNEYLVQPEKTYAVGSAGPDHAIPFNFVKHDQMTMQGSDGVCVWNRE